MNAIKHLQQYNKQTIIMNEENEGGKGFVFELPFCARCNHHAGRMYMAYDEIYCSAECRKLDIYQKRQDQTMKTFYTSNRHNACWGCF